MYLRKLILLKKSTKGAYFLKYLIKIKTFLSHLNSTMSQKV